MSSAGFYFVVFLLALAAYLAARTDRERMPPGGGPSEPQGPLANVFYNFAKWMTILSFLGFIGSVVVNGLPSVWVQPRILRQQMVERAARAGGWEPLMNETRALLATNTQAQLHINPRAETGFVLPAAISVLQPRDLTFRNASNSASALYRLFGMKHSGARPQLNYWLFVVAQGPPDQALETLRRQFTRSLDVRAITNCIYEVH